MYVYAFEQSVTGCCYINLILLKNEKLYYVNNLLVVKYKLVKHNGHKTKIIKWNIVILSENLTYLYKHSSVSDLVYHVVYIIDSIIQSYFRLLWNIYIYFEKKQMSM